MADANDREGNLVETLMAGMGATGLDELVDTDDIVTEGLMSLMVGTMVQAGVPSGVALASAKGNAEIFRYIEGNHLRPRGGEATSWHVDPKPNSKGLPLWWGHVNRGTVLGGVEIGTSALVDPILILDPVKGAFVFAHSMWSPVEEEDGFNPNIMGYREFCDALLEDGVLSREGHDALVSLAPKSRHRTHDTRLRQSTHPIDPITNATFGRGRSSIGPEAYWPQPGSDTGTPTPVKTGKGSAIVSLKGAVDELDFATADEREYRLGTEDRFWLDYLVSLFGDGRDTVTGAQLLAMAGYENPYQLNSQPTMEAAYRSLRKCASTWVSIDTTNEVRNRKRKNGLIYQGTRHITPVANVTFDVDRYTNAEGGEGVYDFEVYLGAPLEEAFPYHAYATAYRQLTAIDVTERTFKSVNTSPVSPSNMAWMVILRRLHSEGLSNTIKLDSLLKELDLPRPDVSDTDSKGRKRTPKELERAVKDAERKRRERLVRQLEKMLDEKKEDGLIADWRYHTDPKTGKTDGFIIKPVRKK